MAERKSKRKRRRKLSSSSSEEEEPATERPFSTGNKSAKKRRSGSSNDRKEEKGILPTIKEDFQKSQKTKKAVYRLAKASVLEQRPAGKEKEFKTTAATNIPTQKKSDGPGKGTFVPVGHTEGATGPSEQSRSRGANAFHKTTEMAAKYGRHIVSPQRDTARLTDNLRSPISIEFRGQKISAVKSISNPLICSKRKVRKSGKTCEPSWTAFPAKRLREKGEGGPREGKVDLVARDGYLKTKKDLLARVKSRDCPDNATEPLSTSAKLTSPTSDKKSNLYKHGTTKQDVTHHKKARLPDPQGRLLVPGQTSDNLKTFEIPKRTKSLPCHAVFSADPDWTSTNVTHGKSKTESSGPVSDVDRLERAGQNVNCCAVAAVPSHLREQDGNSTVSSPSLTPQNYDTCLSHDQIQGDEEQPRSGSERTPEAEVVESHGELTCMDIDSPDESKQPFQQDLILVLDTNILLSHLAYVKKIRTHGLGGLGFPVVLIPWAVLQELDFQKNDERRSGSVATLAIPAVDFIYRCLKNKEKSLWGQSMQQAAESNHRLNAENNDDKVLQCCLQYQDLYSESALILCTDDKNLCSKALLSGVRALSKADLVQEAGRLCAGGPYSQGGPHGQGSDRRDAGYSGYLETGAAAISANITNEEHVSVGGSDDDEEKRRVSSCVSVLESCLLETLANILEVEMKAVFNDLWQDIVFLKPPWTLQHVLKCLNKHWIAVFGAIVPRQQLQTVKYLERFFNSGQKVKCCNTLSALCRAKDLLGVFGNRDDYGGRVPAAASAVDNLLRQLQNQPEETEGQLPAADVTMCVNNEHQATPAQISHQDVWGLFENVWTCVCQRSLDVFVALCFDTSTMRRAQPEVGDPLPQDALVCLHKLCPMVTQLLQAFNRVLSSDMGAEETEALLSFIHASEMVSIQPGLSTTHLLDCFSHQEYREKLRLGGAQLTELKVALELCVEATCPPQHMELNGPGD